MALYALTIFSLAVCAPECKPAVMLSIETWPIDKPIPYPGNPRIISDESVAAVAGSIKDFGFKNPVIVDVDGVVIAGHARLQAAKKLGLLEVPVIVAKDLSPDKVRAFRLADNRVAEFSEWDADALTAELEGTGIEMGYAKFDTLLEDLQALEDEATPYTKTIEAPIYKVTGARPEFSEMLDDTVADKLRRQIADATIPDEVKRFLTAAAGRHSKFNYKNIAEYYAHAPADVQVLMENSALVIVDFGRAIELGFVRLAEETARLYEKEYPQDEAAK